ncbi:MAG: DUF4476 domain-containing protein [Flavobacteriales bacterium]|jgi:hypothetical protein|nr:DUF4476 domain-containing protein [Flavobacteriales bacterium]
MKQLLFTALLITSSTLGALAQKTSNLVIFAEDPKPFYAIVNGIKQNAEPQTNVKITGLTNPNASIKVVFQDGTPDLNKTIWYESMGKEVTMRIVNTKKGYKLRFFGEVAIENAVENADQSVIVYHTTEIQPEPVQPVEQTVTVTEQVVTTTNTNTSPAVSTTTTVPATTQSENVSVGMNIGGFGVNMNVNVNETGTIETTSTSNGADYSSTSTTTTTTTTTTSTSGVDYGASNTQADGTMTSSVVYVSGYTGGVGCPIPESSVQSIKSSIEDESFSDDKMNVAKQAIKNRCITVSQVRDIMSVFDFEDKKLEFAKYAYSRTYDVDNYYLVNKDFDFSSTKEDLNKFLESK